MISKFPIPVLCEDQDKSSYKNSFFIVLLKLDESVVLEKEQLVINFDLSTNLFDSGYFKPSQIKNKRRFTIMKIYLRETNLLIVVIRKFISQNII